MPSVPRVSGAEAIRALERLGFVVVRQRGSHVVLRRGATGCVVPNHRSLKVGTLAGALKQAGIAVDELTSAIPALDTDAQRMPRRTSKINPFPVPEL